MSNVLVPPRYGQHIVAVGSTGSGKSEFMQQLLKCYNYRFMIDTQDSLDKIEGRSFTDPHGLAMRLKFYKSLKYKPGHEYREKDWWNYIFATIAHSSTKKKPKPRVVYIDEAYHVGRGTSYPAELPKAIQTTRQKQISWFVATQRPRQLPQEIFSEAAKVYVFYLSKFDDLVTVSKFGRQSDKELMKLLQDQTDDYSFIEIDNRKGTWTKYPPLKI